ncbi:MAG: hypothetical protein KatS3mg059_0891 [Thermomicrobiales bacterium]|nr:MAG: hypothetical protein KatS3mg059_0891 [Thermomicrobiales bacterium]
MSAERITDALGKRLNRRRFLSRTGTGLVAALAAALGFREDTEAGHGGCHLCLASWSGCIAYCTMGYNRYLYAWTSPNGCWRCYECFAGYNPGTCHTCTSVYCSQEKYIC